MDPIQTTQEQTAQDQSLSVIQNQSAQDVITFEKDKDGNILRTTQPAPIVETINIDDLENLLAQKMNLKTMYTNLQTQLDSDIALLQDQIKQAQSLVVKSA